MSDFHHQVWGSDLRGSDPSPLLKTIPFLICRGLAIITIIKLLPLEVILGSSLSKRFLACRFIVGVLGGVVSAAVLIVEVSALPNLETFGYCQVGW